MKKNLIQATAVFLLCLVSVNIAYAVCPVCTVAVAGCVGLARWLKVDDIISGIWIGGLILSTTLWFINWLKVKKYTFFFYQPLIYIAMYAVIIIPLYYAGIIGHPANTYWGLDKLLLGIIIGSVVFAISVWFNQFLKSRNHGKVYFAFQQVVVPIVLLAIASLIFYILLKCL